MSLRRVRPTPNSVMGEVCSSEGWLFEDVINYFKFLDSKKKNLKIGLCSVRKMYVVCTLLRNAPNAPKKSVKIQHLLHLRVPIVESQKW